MKRLQGIGLMAAVCLLAALLWAAGQEKEALPGVQVDPEAFGNSSLLAFSERDAGFVVAISRTDRGFLALLDESGQTAAREDFGCALLGASCGPEGFFVLQEQDSFLQVTAFSPALERLGSSLVFLPVDNLAMVKCSPQGTVYCVAYDTPGLLQCFFWDGREEQRAFDQNIEGLWVTAGGQAWVRAGGLVYMGDAEAPQGIQLVKGGAQAIGVVGEGIFCDDSGALWQAGDGGAQLLMQGSFPPNLCWAGPQGVLWARDVDRIARLDWDGSVQADCQVDGEVLALTGTGVLYTGTDGICFASHQLFLQKDDPTPPPAASDPERPLPSSEGPLPSWEPVYRDGYVIVPPGALAEELRRLELPQELEIRTAQGEPVEDGPLATGMTAGDSRVVVLGDCDGSGGATGRDVEIAQKILLEGSEDELPLLAADMDMDGVLTTADLTYLSACAR